MQENIMNAVEHPNAWQLLRARQCGTGADVLVLGSWRFAFDPSQFRVRDYPRKQWGRNCDSL
jgi:hypothetical protein